MDKIRLVYSQTGRAVWMSHLDTMRTLQRAMNRSGVPIKYSEGFNPHALISILMPLSVGTESLCQMADIRVREEVDLAALPARLTAGMPEGIVVTDAYEDAGKPAEVKWLACEGRWEYDTADPLRMAELCRELFSAPVVVTRRTKRGEGPFTVTEHVRELTFTPEETGRYSLRLWVQDARPEKPYTLCAYVDVIVDPAELAFKNTFNKRDYALVGEELTFDAELTGGVAPYTYSLEVKDDSNAWKSIVENSTDSKLTWEPDAPGRYSLRIVAADQRGWTKRYYPDVTVEKALVFEEMPQKTNRTAITSAVSFEAAVSGGFSNNYTFTLERKNVNENGEYTWDLIDTQVSNNGAAQFVFQPSEVTTYVFRLAARDVRRKAAYVYFTLQVDEDADILG